jgi:tripartite-type tricarboxylate transporter receptor subunit TctC
MKRYPVALLAVAALLVAGSALQAQPVEPFTNKNMQLLIGFGTGGGYDMWGRLVARHIGRNLAGKPTIVPQNMPGAGSFVATSHIYNAAPKDGTVFGIIARDAALGPLLGAPGARYDATKLSWLGTPAKETNVCIAYNTKKVKTAEDLFTNELILGDTGPGTGTRQFPRALAQVLGMKFRNVSGFPSSADVFLALERGEVDGFCESLDSIKSRRPDWIPQKKVAVLFQGGVEKNPELKDVPIIIDFAKTEEQKRIIEFLYSGQGIGRPFVAPPNMPPERLKTLRNAFAATMKDPDFVADVKNSKFELDPEDGDHLQSLIEKIYATPKAIVDKVGELVK